MPMVEDRRPAQRLGQEAWGQMGCVRLAMSQYADIGNYLAVSPLEAGSQRIQVSKALNNVGLRTHETVHGATLVESLGVRVDGLQGRVT